MAQPVFDEHPLEQYLKEAGEMSSLMPGGLEELLGTLEDDQEISLEEVETIEKLVYDLLEPVISAFASHSFSAFVERFKYNVISSSLLSTTLTTPYASRTTPHGIPGNLNTRGHSRSSSLDTTETNQQHQQHSHSLISESQYFTVSLAIALLLILIGAGYYFSSLLLGAFLLYILTTDTTSTVTTPTLDTLNDLISAGNVWDSVVQEVMTTLERDEKRLVYGSSAPSSPRSCLRVALHSTLLTTQNQCDNVRQLLSALASHTELSQLSHMYAPPSPLSSKGSFLSSTSPASRPYSLPTRRRSISNPNFHADKNTNDKRATWNGSYASLANAGSPTMQILKRREKRRSDLSALLNVTSPTKSASAPVTPCSDDLLGGLLENVVEVPDESSSEESDGSPETDDTNNVNEITSGEFGVAALELRRRRRVGGLRALSGGGGSVSHIPQTPTPSTRLRSNPRNPQPNPNCSTIATPGGPRSPPILSPRSSFSTLGASASRFTSINPPRHPLSLSALNSALSNAIASKRYACSHLLALRFEEERDEEAYWEDVRSVMSLLTSAFVGSSARLTEALEEVERERLRDEVPSPVVRGGELEVEESGSEGGGGEQKVHFTHRRNRSSRSKLAFSSSSSSSIGFAPMPSHVARFAAHVDAISCALNDAREQLEECVAALRERESGDDSDDGEEGGSSSPLRGEDHITHDQQQHPALQAYERLRRELGLALRECERGREKLLDVVSPPRNPFNHSDEEDDEEDVPGLGHDIRSDESDGKPDSMENEHHHSHAHTQFSPLITVVNPTASDPSGERGIDDVTSHLLLTATSEHLPPPGIEQVYEASSDSVGVFKRERSNLSREERIEMVKKARESGKRLSDLGIRLPLLEDVGGDGDGSLTKMEKWGPGGEVVQELKDVIWKVGERRRKMGDSLSGATAAALPPPTPQSAPPILRAG